MAYRDPTGEDDEADLHDREDPDPSDTDGGDDDDRPETAPCPYCGKAVYEDADVCPHCGSFIVDDAPARRPWWVVAGVAVCLVIVLIWVVSHA